jgi:hypothetical protein
MGGRWSCCGRRDNTWLGLALRAHLGIRGRLRTALDLHGERRTRGAEPNARHSGDDRADAEGHDVEAAGRRGFLRGGNRREVVR